MNKIVIFLLAISSMSQMGLADKKDIHILFLGRTGTGKSSLINIFYSHIEGKRYDDPRDIVVPLLDRHTRYDVNVERFKAYGVMLSEQGHSQTSEVHEYTAENRDFKVHLWDTPGFIDTKVRVTDEEQIRKIVSQIGNQPIHAVAVVLKASDLDRDSLEVLVSVNRVRTMLPKSAAKNIFGVVNRVGALSSAGRQSLGNDFTRLFEIPEDGLKPNVYAIDGVNFFDPEDADREWARDRVIVERVVADAARLSPVNGYEVREIQRIVSELESKIGDAKTVEAFTQSEAQNLDSLRNDLLASERRRDNDEFGRFLSCAGNTPMQQLMKFTHQDALKNYHNTLAEIDTTRGKITDAHAAQSYWNGKAAALKIEILALRRQRERIAMSTNLDALIRYLDERIRSVRSDNVLKEDERESRIKVLSKQRDIYSAMN